MGRHTSIYMFNKEKAAANLYEDLQHRIYHAGTFKKFIEDRNKEFSDYHYNISFDTILETVKNNINMITPDELFALTLFFDEEVYPQFYNAPLSERDQYFEKLYDHSGLPCFMKFQQVQYVIRICFNMQTIPTIFLLMK